MAIASLVPLSFLCFLLNLASQATAQPQYNVCVTERGTFVATPTYKANLNTLLANLTSNTQNDYGFYNLSYGQSPDKVTVIGLCRGDLKPDACRRCLNDARALLPNICPDNKEAIAFYENCMLRYSNRSIMGVVEDTPWYPRWNGVNVTNVDQYNQVLLNKLLPELRSDAASGDSRRKFAAGNATVTMSQTIFGLVQCTPDLSRQLCIDCLDEAFSEISKCCNSVGNVTIGRPSCNVRYGTQRFYDATADKSTKVQTNTTTSTEGKSNTSQTVIAIVVPVVVFIILLLLVCIYLRMKRPIKNIEGETKAGDEEIEPIETLKFDFDTIKVTTNNFSDENKLGQGGFGVVYKVKITLSH
ncbi:hypothetical protein L6164_032154 [Bauhinia variegata]|uniref:Uncharacterized protein n=1 Tax=Bauhinia variegata TaxID=167791 RepID=A0ACB9KNJ1_BAUVA|nr:hypothetical protein L6164_032154 [Bauhinia variegata]